MRQVWATYSVSSHLEPRAFVADVMQYDKLVIPAPAQGDEASWKHRGWDADRQQRLLQILGKRAQTITWDDQWKALWESRYKAAKEVASQTSPGAMNITASVLLAEVPPGVTGVTAVASYSAPEQLQDELNLIENQAGVPPGKWVGPGTLAAVIGREFLVPNDPEMSDEELLMQAVELSGDERFQRKRAAYWRWQNEFLAGATIRDPLAIEVAVEEMNDLIAEERDAIFKSRVKLGVSCAFAVGVVVTGMAAAPLVPVAIGAGFLSVGGWIYDHWPELASKGEPKPGPAAMCLCAQRAFGWK
jgi:hypothetical protein